MSEEFKIEKGIPIPRPRYGNGLTAVLRSMDVGDSVFIGVKGIVGVSGFVGALKPQKYTCRTVTENGVKGVRVWRIA